MNESWQVIFDEWFPKELKQHYPIKISKQYTSSQRWEIYERLTKEQRIVIDQHRRYLIHSRFLEENYLAATDWVFSDFKINPFFRTSRRQQKLYCECGRELKVQYIVRSSKTGKELKLGINHFAEHLHVSPTVAASINQGMTKVDLALDEILWLKQQNIAFPERLWQEYCLMLYHNRRLKQPILPDKKLTTRIAEFRQAQLPIYLADYQAMEKYIQQVGYQTKDKPKKFLGKKTLFEDFSEELTKDVENFLSNYQLFLQKDWSSVSFEEASHPSVAFFEKFIADLREGSREEKHLDVNRLAKEQRFIQPQIYHFVWQQYQRYGFTTGFFDSIPRVMRNGFLKTLRKEREEKQQAATKTVSEIEWQELAKKLKQQSVRSLMEAYGQANYVFTSEQQLALKKFQELESVIQTMDEETRMLIKELF
ncbi:MULTISPECIES: hypothetical protein [unclassified Enterococcus]|uniref:hypothetical protein n=1 Tax=unclassified Enterococcus TaxID=2608891 RepID=UPI001A9A78F6|nr:hypothetical protein [Enterococcus sp. DIV1271a]MBO1301044.1 hypothetical protein [Enterococcus sp. DIV1271a]